MSDEPTPGHPEQPLQQIQHSAATARVPEAVGRGVFSTGVIVLHGPNEYTIDFVQTLARPGRVAARVVLPPAVASQFVIALEQVLEKYAAAHGSPTKERESPPTEKPAVEEKPAAAQEPAEEQEPPTQAEKPAPEAKPAPPVPQQSPISDIYDSLKLPDDMLGGVYANVVSISYSASEFCFDFIAQFFPRSAVTARVYLAVPRVPELLSSLKRSIGGGR